MSWLAPLAQPLPAVARRAGIDRTARLDGAVALTFDDGPHPQGTPAVLEILREHGARATFFLVGEQVRATGALHEEIRAAGHAVAVHGDRHRCLLRLTAGQTTDDLAAAEQRIAPTVSLHRAPLGIYTGRALRAVRAHGWRPLLWSRDGRDWRARATAQSITARVTRGVAAGDVLLLHDADTYSSAGSHRATVAALPRILDALGAAGLATAIPGASAGGSTGH